MTLILVISAILLFASLGWYYWRFYPRQLVNPTTIQNIVLTTPEPEKYHNDCLHPCIRKAPDGSYWMVQSPWYSANDGVENPILYRSNNPYEWNEGVVVEDTPSQGYNSDPNLFIDEDGTIFVFWREVDTLLCEKMGKKCLTVGVSTNDGKSFSTKQIYLYCDDENVDTEMCPILVKRNGMYYFYATWYKRDRQDRHNLGIAIWEGTNLKTPYFSLKELVPIKPIRMADKWKQLWIGSRLFFIPIPHKFDLWHFDLFTMNGELFMVACEEMKDLIMIGNSSDWKNFTFNRTALLNAHAMEKSIGHREAYYKPTALVEDKELTLFYTANGSIDYKANILHAAKIDIGHVK